MVSRLRGNDSLGAGWQFGKLTQIYVVANLENAVLARRPINYEQRGVIRDDKSLENVFTIRE
jgi:hypothetical protein